ncbi:MAG: hypothetical protein RLZZ618_920 [Pseudomonadota bacterium]|jgi:REP element-mobilizing transposase RayT
MTRPLRIEFPGAIYHVTSRGDRREPIFEDDDDRRVLLGVLHEALERFDASMLAYCLMGNHYHFVLQTRRPNLSRVMRHINGVYTQLFNARHGKVGHLFQGRFKAILVDRDAYLLEVCRYVELNPVRARMVRTPGEWPWSSYRAHLGQVVGPPWLDTPAVHAHMLGRDVSTAEDVLEAIHMYADLVASAPDHRLWDEALRQQIYLGDDAFIDRMQLLAEAQRKRSCEVPLPQRSSPKTLQQWLAISPTREEALRRGYTESGLKMSDMAKEMNLTLSRVSQLIRRATRSLEEQANKDHERQI